jgi:GxxExxY protein
MYEPVPAETEQVASGVIGGGIEVHRILGPGFLERIYHDALCFELHARGIAFEREKAITVRYKDLVIPGQRIDLVVAGCVVVELKAASRIDEAVETKLISYLRTTGLRLGLVMNFNAPTLKAGLKRVVV